MKTAKCVHSRILANELHENNLISKKKKVMNSFVEQDSRSLCQSACWYWCPHWHRHCPCPTSPRIEAWDCARERAHFYAASPARSYVGTVDSHSIRQCWTGMGPLLSRSKLHKAVGSSRRYFDSDSDYSLGSNKMRRSNLSLIDIWVNLQNLI